MDELGKGKADKKKEAISPREDPRKDDKKVKDDRNEITKAKKRQ